MITKYQMISYLAEDTAKQIAKNGQEGTKYLTTAARLYKYPFHEQMLIYAQRPDATACASIEIWNEKMNCWVNRGAKGIALLDTESERPRLKYVFDVLTYIKQEESGVIRICGNCGRNIRSRCWHSLKRPTGKPIKTVLLNSD